MLNVAIPFSSEIFSKFLSVLPKKSSQPPLLKLILPTTKEAFLFMLGQESDWSFKNKQEYWEDLKTCTYPASVDSVVARIPISVIYVFFKSSTWTNWSPSFDSRPMTTRTGFLINCTLLGFVLFIWKRAFRVRCSKKAG